MNLLTLVNVSPIQESEEIKSNSLDQKLKEKEMEFTQHLQEKNDHMEVIVLYDTLNNHHQMCRHVYNVIKYRKAYEPLIVMQQTQSVW